MITEVPISEDFYNAGIDYLNLAWEQALELGEEADSKALNHPISDVDQIDDFAADWDLVGEKYQRAEDRAYAPIVKQRLATSISLALQGIEFILKSRIVEVSPYLLISHSPKDWPKNSSKKDIAFSEFRTINAEDLPQICNVVCKERLPEQFVPQFHALRKLRNTVTHTIDKSIEFSTRDVVLRILEMSTYLIANKTWLKVRREYVDKGPALEYAIGGLWSEFETILRILTPSECRKYLKYEKKRKRFLCYVCEQAIHKHLRGDNEPLAYLDPLGEKSTTMFCPICADHVEVLRGKCKCSCRSKVLDPLDQCCLECGAAPA